jgi:hypothetical protein
MSINGKRSPNIQQLPLWGNCDPILSDELQLVAAAFALGAGEVANLSPEEASLRRSVAHIKLPARHLSMLRDAIRAGEDPLGDVFCYLRPPEMRRDSGATYTPPEIVRTMLDWARDHRSPERVIDPGVGSARFLAAAAARFPKADLVGLDIDPVAAVLARANLAVLGAASRTRIVLRDYRKFRESIKGATLYVGNPPYVRHHQILSDWKDWLSKSAADVGLIASKLSGLHVHFLLATALNAKARDFGVFITAAEWLDVNYGSLVRSLVLNQLGGSSVTVIDPAARPFRDAATTAAIVTFDVGSRPSSLFFTRVETLKKLRKLQRGRKISRDRLAAETRWSHLSRPIGRAPDGFVELGDLCRVHRGQVTGANGVWIAGNHSAGLPKSVLFRSVTKAREVLDADGILSDSSKLRCVIDIPPDLDRFGPAERKAIEDFIRFARNLGAHNGYIARHRRAWWSVGLRVAAPIISSYMARRPPAFVINKARARHINIAHGLYPQVDLTEYAKNTLVQYLQTNVSQRLGRTYAGGLTKFEPREMERLIVPGPAMLEAGVIG